MNGNSLFKSKILTKCPHCRGKITFEVKEAIEAIPLTLKPDGSIGRAELSIVCVTRAEDKVISFLKLMCKHAEYLDAEFVLCLDISRDNLDRYPIIQNLAPVITVLESKGYVESILETAFSATKGNWILRLDDDEEISYGMLKWLKARKYLEHDVWMIPTAALWPNENMFITSPPLWPDQHMRLFTWDKATWPDHIHAGAPEMGPMAPVAIKHHKYLISSYKDRLTKARNYDIIKPGAGTGAHLAFTLPEQYFDEISVAPLGMGYFPQPGNMVGEGKRISLKGKCLDIDRRIK
jgi:hypothetical protein